MKKILALCLTVMLVLAMVPVIGVAAADVVTLSVGKASAEIGAEVTVSVSIDSNPGICSAKFLIEYDADAFEVVAHKNKGLGMYPAAFSPKTANPFIVNWAPSLEDITDTGEVATVTFRVKDTAKVGKYTLKVTSAQKDIFNTSMEEIPFTTVDGEIEVICKHGTTNIVGAKDATCSEEGYTGDKVCTACGEIVEAGKAIAMSAHTEVVEGAFDATCSAVGSTGTTKCSVCGEVIKAAEEIAKKPHTEVVEGAKDATCTEAGSTGTTKCSVCGEVIKEAEVIDAKGHTEVLVGAKDATCEDAGYTGDKKCSVCGITLEEGKAIDAKGHDIAEVAAKEATCDEDGNIAHFACSVCGETYADIDGTEAITDVIIKATGHDYADGKCKVCGEDEPKEEEKPADKPAEKPADKPNTDNGDKAPATNDVANIFVVASVLMAIAAAAVVVLKKKA